MKKIIELKVFHWLLVVVLVLPYLMSTVALAEGIENRTEQSVFLLDGVLQAEVDQENADLTLNGSLANPDSQEIKEEIKLSDNLLLEEVSDTKLLNLEQQEIGHYQVTNKTLLISINPNQALTKWQLRLTGKLVTDDLSSNGVLVAVGEQELLIETPAIETAESLSEQLANDSSELQVSENEGGVADLSEPQETKKALIPGRNQQESRSLPAEENMDPIQSFPGIQLLDEIGGIKVPASHSFFPKKTYETEISVSLPDGSTYSIDDQVVTIIPIDQDALEGSIYYKDVGYYKNKVLDIRVDFSVKNASKIRVSDLAYYDLFNASTSTYTEATITSHFIDNETGNPIKVSGNITIDNINRAKFLGIDLADYLEVYAMKDSVIIANEDPEVGNWLFSSIDYKGTPQVRLTMLYDEKDTLSFTMRAPRAVGNVNSSFGAGYTPDKSLVNFEILESTKKGASVEESSTVHDLYTIYQDNPYQAVPIQSFALEDQLHELLIVRPEDVSIADSVGKEVSDRFTITIDSANLLNIQAKPETVSSETFYNETYIIHLRGRLDKSNGEYLELIKNGYVEIPNVLVTKVDDDQPKSSNIGTAKIKVEKTTVLVKHQDESGAEVSPTITLTDYEGASYETTAADLSDYEVETPPANATGKYSDVTQEVIYVYRKKQGAEVTVNYVDSQGNQLASTEKLSGKLGETYTALEKAIVDYELITQPSNTTGKFTTEPQEVNFVYRKKQGAAVTVKHIDQDGKTLVTTEVLNGKIGDTYTTSAKNITNYVLKTAPTNPVGKFTSQAQEVVYVYEKEQGKSVTVKYVNEKGDILAPAKILIGRLDDPYETTALKITDYELSETPANAEGIFTTEAQEVVYVYTKKQGATVTVKHVDQAGKNLLPPETLTGKLDEVYKTQGRSIVNYVVVETPENAEGTFTKEPQEVVYVYDKQAGESVTVKYLDEFGSAIYQADVLTGKVTEPYKTVAKDVPDFELHTAPSNAEGLFTDQPQEVIYVYTKKTGGRVIENHLDQAGNQLILPKILLGKVGDPYKTGPKNIENYVLIATPSNAEGVFTYDEQDVNYYYEKAEGESVTVKYVDEAGNLIAQTDVLRGKIDDAYKTFAKVIEDYQLVVKPENATGKYTTTPQDVVYIYTKRQGGQVTVKHVDQAGKELVSAEGLTGKIGDSYVTQAKAINKYVLLAAPSNGVGVFKKAEQTVTYIYEKAEGASVTVKYVDEDGNQVANSDILKGKLAEPYQTKEKVIPDYQLISTPNNAEGIYTENAQEVIYVYTKKPGGNVTVKHVDKDGKNLVTPEVLTGKLDQPYETQVKNITNYKLITTPTNGDGKFTHEPQEVVYVYDKEQGESVTVKYVDQSGNQISQGETLTGKIADPYKTTAKTIADYEVASIPNNASGFFTTESQEVIYVYNKKQGANVTVKHVDQAGKELVTKEILKGKIGDNYESQSKNIKNYVLIAVPGNAKGKYTYEPQTVIYVYEKAEGATVTVKYIDEFGTTIFTAETLRGKIDAPYETAPQTIANYDLIVTPNNAKGVFTTEPQEVVYVYTKTTGGTVNVKYVDADGNQLISPKTLLGKVGETYKSGPKNVKDYFLVATPHNAEGTFTKERQEVLYIYERVAGQSVIVKYLDEEGNLISASDILQGKIGETYQTKAKTIPDYTLVKTPINASGKFTDQPQEVTYLYTKKNGAQITVKHVDERGKELVASSLLSGKVGEEYQTQGRNIKDYILLYTPSNARGEFTYDEQEVVYVYEKAQGGSVTVKYVDEAGNLLSFTDVLVGKIGSRYETRARTIALYELIAEPDNKSGNYTETAQEVIYRYQKKQGGAVIVKHVDESGSDLRATETLVGELGSEYETQAKNILHYHLKTTPANAQGKFVLEEQEVVYIYEKNQGGSVTVKYVDESGELLSASDTLSGKQGEVYTTKAKEIVGYELAEKPANAEGQFTDQAQEVIYRYQKKQGAAVTVKHLTKGGQELVPAEVLTGKVSETYETSPKNIEGYVLVLTPANANGVFMLEKQEVIYVYEKIAGGTVTVKYVDQEANLLATSETLTGELGETYTTKAKEITDYQLLSQPKNAQGQFTAKSQEVIYIYKKKTTSNNGGNSDGDATNNQGESKPGASHTLIPQLGEHAGTTSLLLIGIFLLASDGVVAKRRRRH